MKLRAFEGKYLDKGLRQKGQTDEVCRANFDLLNESFCVSCGYDLTVLAQKQHKPSGSGSSKNIVTTVILLRIP